MAVTATGTVTHSKTLIHPSVGTEDRVYGSDYVDPNSHTVTVSVSGAVDTANSPAANEFARFTDTDTIEGRTVAETKSDLSLGNVENTALSTWAGSTSITTLGTIATGVWNGTIIGVGKGGTGNSTGTATINANLTGPITSVGNATAVAAQTGTGSVFAMQASPTFTGTVVAPAINGSTAANGDITIQGTSSATRTTSYVNLQPSGGLVGIGTTAPVYQLDIRSGTTYAVMRLGLAIGNSLRTDWYLDSDTGYGAVINCYNDSNSTYFPVGLNGSFVRLEIAGTTKVKVDAAGNTGFGGNTAPTAKVHPAAGTATANTAPKQFNDGPRETAARAGLQEFDKNHYFSNWKSLRFPVGGTLFDFAADVSVGGAETDIFTSTLKADTFAVDKDKVIGSYSGNFVTLGTELTQLKAYFAGTAIWDSTGITMASGTSSWRVLVELFRVSATVVRYCVSLQTSGASGYVYCSSGELTGLTLTGTNILKVTGTSSGVGSGAGDIVGKSGYVEFKPAAN